MEYVWLALTGVVAGVMGGMLGIGGSVIMIPAMTLILGASDASGREMIHQYQAAALIVNFLLIVPSVVAHARRGAIWTGVWKYVAGAALASIALGVWVSYRFSGADARALRWLLGLFFVYIIFENIWRLTHPARVDGLPREQVEAMPAWRKIIIGVPTGFVGGFLGIGGGVVAVPAQQLILRMPLRNAIATSAAVIASASWLGAVYKNWALAHEGAGSVWQSFALVSALAPTAMIGSYLGAILTHALPRPIVRTAFILLMLISAWGMLRDLPAGMMKL